MAGLGHPTLGSQTAMPDGEAPEAGADPRIAELEALLAAATAEAEKGREDWLRAKAESDNIRRRAQEDVAKAHRYALEGFANALLAVKDSMDAALTVENTSIESFKEGVELTARQLQAAFEKFAIREIVPQGEKFDPQGDYVRRYVPALRDIAGPAVHQPWQLALQLNYPPPQVLL